MKGRGQACELPSHENFTASKRTVALPNGIRLAYVELGDPAGEPVSLLHGFTDTARSWTLIARHLAKNFRLVAPDLRGHGQSDKPDGCYTIRKLANDVRLLTEVLRIAPVHVFGHSLGGRLAQAFAERWPDSVGRIVLMSTSAVPRERAGWLWETSKRSGIRIDPESECHPGMVFRRGADRRDLPVSRPEGVRLVPARIWRSIYYEQLAYDPLPLLRDISAPTLILRGAEDHDCDRRAPEPDRGAASPARNSFSFQDVATTCTGRARKPWRGWWVDFSS